MTTDKLSKLCIDPSIKLTDLRKDVLSILYTQDKPMGAYDILDELKKKRPNAEPPTVYRVLEFLVEVKLVHRIESQNAFVCCSHLNEAQTQHQAILLSCKECQGSFEFKDENVIHAIKKFADKNHLQVDSALLEVKGVCKSCLSK